MNLTPLSPVSVLSISERIQLVLARVEILKLKAANGGYEWACHVPQDVKDQVEETLTEINSLLGVK